MSTKRKRPSKGEVKIKTETEANAKKEKSDAPICGAPGCEKATLHHATGYCVDHHGSYCGHFYDDDTTKCCGKLSAPLEARAVSSNSWYPPLCQEHLDKLKASNGDEEAARKETRKPWTTAATTGDALVRWLGQMGYLEGLRVSDLEWHSKKLQGVVDWHSKKLQLSSAVTGAKTAITATKSAVDAVPVTSATGSSSSSNSSLSSLLGGPSGMDRVARVTADQAAMMTAFVESLKQHLKFANQLAGFCDTIETTCTCAKITEEAARLRVALEAGHADMMRTAASLLLRSADVSRAITAALSPDKAT